MLPSLVIKEIFNLQYKASDISLQHIADELESFGLTVKNVTNYDHAIVYEFGTIVQPIIFGELRVDRIQKTFSIVATFGDATILPVNGDWQIIDKFLECLIALDDHAKLVSK